MRETAAKRTFALDSGRDVVMRSLSPPSFPGISFVVFVFVARVMTVKIQSPKELGIDSFSIWQHSTPPDEHFLKHTQGTVKPTRQILSYTFFFFDRSKILLYKDKRSARKKCFGKQCILKWVSKIENRFDVDTLTTYYELQPTRVHYVHNSSWEHPLLCKRYVDLLWCISAFRAF